MESSSTDTLGIDSAEFLSPSEEEDDESLLIAEEEESSLDFLASFFLDFLGEVTGVTSLGSGEFAEYPMTSGESSDLCISGSSETSFFSVDTLELCTSVISGVFKLDFSLEDMSSSVDLLESLEASDSTADSELEPPPVCAEDDT